MSVAEIAPEAVFRLSQQETEIALIDVRTPAEFASWRASGARNVPLETLTPQAIETAVGTSGRPVYLICKSGTRSAQAAQKLVGAGRKNVHNVVGGTEAWQQAGLPIIRGRWMLPLDRQVQLTAGLMALIGGLLGFLVNYWFFILPTFVGFGLTVAGSTGFCPMGLLLARMPWNTKGSTPVATTCCAR